MPGIETEKQLIARAGKKAKRFKRGAPEEKLYRMSYRPSNSPS